MAIKQKFVINICKSSIYNILHKFNITHKKIKKRKIYGCKQKLKIKVNNFKKKVKNIHLNDIISIDEINFDTNTSTDYG